jgi:hypothetical protein
LSSKSNHFHRIFVWKQEWSPISNVRQGFLPILWGLIIAFEVLLYLTRPSLFNLIQRTFLTLLAQLCPSLTHFYKHFYKTIHTLKLLISALLVDITGYLLFHWCRLFLKIVFNSIFSIPVSSSVESSWAWSSPMKCS